MANEPLASFENPRYGQPRGRAGTDASPLANAQQSAADQALFALGQVGHNQPRSSKTISPRNMSPAHIESRDNQEVSIIAGKAPFEDVQANGNTR